MREPALKPAVNAAYVSCRSPRNTFRNKFTNPVFYFRRLKGFGHLPNARIWPKMLTRTLPTIRILCKLPRNSRRIRANVVHQGDASPGAAKTYDRHAIDAPSRCKPFAGIVPRQRNIGNLPTFLPSEFCHESVLKLPDVLADQPSCVDAAGIRRYPSGHSQSRQS